MSEKNRRKKLRQYDRRSPVWEHNFRGRFDADGLATCEIATGDETEYCGRGRARCWRDARCCHSDGSGGGHSSERARNRCEACRSRKPPRISFDGHVWLPLGLIHTKTGVKTNALESGDNVGESIRVKRTFSLPQRSIDEISGGGFLRVTSSTLLRMTHSVTSIDAYFLTPRCIRHGWLLLELRRLLLLLRWFRLQVLLQVSLQLAERQLFGGFERICVGRVVFQIRATVVAVVVEVIL